jgi:hypothetical protein
MARLVRKLSERIKSEPIDFVKNALVCGDRALSLHVDSYCIPQRNGTAVHSLAVGQLQELESLDGSERQKQEEVVSVAMGSIYHGEALYSRIRALTRPLFSRFRHGACI